MRTNLHVLDHTGDRSAPRVCQQCGSVFSRHISTSDLRRNSYRYCSRSCARRAQHGPPEVRFWSQVSKTETCWIWMGSLMGSGYGRITDGTGERIGAHCFSWALHYGPVPDGQFVLHHCDNPLCVRPDHLFTGSQAENLADMRAKGRAAKGERHGSRTHPEAVLRGDEHWTRKKPDRIARGESRSDAVLDTDSVRELRKRREQGASYSQLAAEFSISRSHACRIVLRQGRFSVPSEAEAGP